MPENESDSKEIKREDAIAQLRYLERLYSQQYEVINDEIATYTIGLSGLRKNIEFLDTYGSIKGINTLINCEGGTYVHAKIAESSTVLTYIGAGYLVEKGIEEAKAFVKENEKKEEEILKKLSVEKQKISAELADITYRLGALEQQVS